VDDAELEEVDSLELDELLPLPDPLLPEVPEEELLPLPDPLLPELPLVVPEEEPLPLPEELLPLPEEPLPPLEVSSPRPCTRYRRFRVGSVVSAETMVKKEIRSVTVTTFIFSDIIRTTVRQHTK
jgi:hypothetical protein